MMPTDDPDTLSLRVANENLHRAIDRLEALGGLGEFPEAYQTLVLERSRRELQSPADAIRLSRAAFRDLPPDVQQLLTTPPS
jgi:hypothetical protein